MIMRNVRVCLIPEMMIGNVSSVIKVQVWMNSGRFVIERDFMTTTWHLFNFINLYKRIQ